MSIIAQLSEELEGLVARTVPSVVGVEHQRGQGTGVVLSPDGYVITNAHVVQGARRALRVRLAGGEALDANLIGTDERSDLAVVRVDARDMKPLVFADRARLKVGQLVVAIGNPLRFEGSVSLGVISAIDRSLPARRALFEGLIQTDAAINPGNSGGPLINAAGAVVGINTAVIPYAQGLGFAIPAHTASWVSAVLIQRGEVQRPMIGIAARSEPLPPALAAQLGQSRAVRVLGVNAGGPAARAGVREGDLLLTVGEHSLLGIDDLQRTLVLSSVPEIDVRLARGEERRQVTVRPDRGSASAA